MEQGREARDAAPVEVWGEAKAEVEWVDHLPQGQAEVVFAPNVATRKCILLDNLVMQKVVLNVVQK